MRFSTLVAATELGQDAERALPVAAALARRGDLPVELLAVAGVDEDEDRLRADLCRAAAALGIERSTPYVDRDPSTAGAITAHVTNRDGALLVLATTGGAAAEGNRLGAITEQVLAAVLQPVLVIGPHASARRSVADHPVVVVDGTGFADVLVDPVVDWSNTFGGATSTVVEVVPPSGWPDEDPPAGHGATYVERLAARGVSGRSAVLRATDVASAVTELVRGRTDALAVMASPRWEGDPSHWFGTVRRVIRAATCPVLVVPADLAER